MLEWTGTVVTKPWVWGVAWSRASQAVALENARVAAVACSRARVERLEVELYVEEVAARRREESRPA